MNKRVISAFLLVVMLISLFPVQAFAAEAAENNSAVVSDVENAETQSAEEAAPADEAAPPEDDFSGEEVEIFAIPEPEYEEKTEEESEAEPTADSAGENSASISFSGAEYCADSQKWRYTIEADAGETVDLQVFPEYDGELTYVWQHFDSSSEAYLDVDAADNISSLTVTLTDDDFSEQAPYLCHVYAADGAMGCAEFELEQSKESIVTVFSTSKGTPLTGTYKEKLDQLEKIQNGKYWAKDNCKNNRYEIKNQLDNYDYSSCLLDYPTCSANVEDHIKQYETCCKGNYFGAGKNFGWCLQCNGYVHYLAYALTGKPRVNADEGGNWNTTTWRNETPLNYSDFQLEPGDILLVGLKSIDDLHWMMVWKIENGDLYLAQCNFDGQCKITFGKATIEKDAIKKRLRLVSKAPGNTGTPSTTPSPTPTPTPTPTSTSKPSLTSDITPEDYLKYFAQSSKDINQTAVASGTQAWKLPWTHESDNKLKLETVSGTITLIREIHNHVNGNKWYEYKRGDDARGFVYSEYVTIQEPQVTKPYYSAPTISGRTADNAVLSTTINNPSQLTATKGGVLLAQSSSALSDSNIANTSGYKSFIESVASGYETKTSIPCAYNLKKECRFTLQPGTTYYYRFVVEVSGGQRYYSNVYSFTTSGTAQVTFSSPEVLSLTTDNVELRTAISNPSKITISAAGVWLATSEAELIQGNPSQQRLLTTLSGYETKTYIRCSYILKDECKLSLRAGTTYYYQFVTTDKSGNIYKSSIYSFTTTGSIAVSLISLSPLEGTVYIGETLQFSADVSPSDAANKAINWSSDKTSVAVVSSSGVVTAKAVGTARITATAADGSGVTATATITVRPVMVSSVNISPDGQTLYVGETAQLSADVSPSNATNKTINWSSDNTSVATVSSSGVVTAKAVGTAKITASAADGSGVTASAAITVNPVPVSSVNISPDGQTLYVGEKVQLSADVSPSDAANKTISWSSDDTSVAIVSSSGLVTAKGEGETVITAAAMDGSGVSASIAITVNPVPVSSISITPAMQCLYVGKTLQLLAEVSPSEAADKTVSWSSDNTDVADISDSGLVTPLEEGTATITATANDGSGVSASVEFTVEKDPDASGDGLTWTLDDDGTLTISGSVAMEFYTYSDSPWSDRKEEIKNVIIESGVTSIGYGAFLDCNNLKNITIPDSVTSIDWGAFWGCSSLTSVIIPDSVTSIGYNVFSYCSGLTSVTIPSGVTSIGRSAFWGCSSLTSITIPDSVTSFGSGAFYGCSSLASITIPDSVTSIDSFAFCECSSLLSITIPDSVTSIGACAFWGCSSLTRVIIPDSVTSIGGAIFSACSNLTSITIGGGIASIGNGFFSGIENLESVTINNGVTSIGKYAFWGCSNLASITIPDTVTSIDSYAFYECSSLLNITIPESVTSIGEGAFYGCSSLASVTINNGVTSIGKYAFKGCSNLASITIPDSVTSIGKYAFYKCSSLTSITIPDSVTSIGECAFGGCSSLASITIPDTVTSIDSYAFYECSSLLSITIPDSVTSIGYAAFAGCSSLASIMIPDSVTSIGECAFGGCSSLASIAIPDGVTEIGWNTLYGCSNLTSITIGDGITSIDDWDFSELGNLEKVIIGSGVTRIGNGTFSCCSSLTSITIPGSVTSIGKYAFYKCSSLTSIAIPDGVTEIDWSTLYGCSNLTSITIGDGITSIDDWDFSELGNLEKVIIGNGVESIGERAFSGCSSLTSVTIGNGVTSIGKQAFSGCRSITSLTIPDSVTEILDRAFEGCSSLTSITIPDSVTEFWWSAISGCSSLTSITIGGGLTSIDTSIDDEPLKDFENLETVTIGNGVTRIGRYAFSGCSNLTSVIIPDSVTSIDWGAFSGCSSLKNITIPNNMTYIGGAAFYGCSSLTSITIPDNVSCIDSGTFYGCSGLASITIPDSVTDISLAAFCGCSSLTSVTIPDSVTNIGGSAFYGCSSLTSVTIPDSVTNIGGSAFEGCSSLTSVTIPDSVTNIGGSAFYGCSSLTSVTIPDSVTNIGGSAFYGCGSLTSITIPDSVTNIGGSAFYGCSSLTSITIPDSVSNIGSYAFYGCSSLTGVTIGNSVTSIGSCAFWDCNNLANITIPDRVTDIGSYAFYNCSSLTSITIPGSVTSIGYSAFEDCSSLTSITIPDSVTEIYWNAFDGCSSLTSITIGNGITSIGDEAFSELENLEKVIIGNGVTSIGKQAFLGCKALTSVTIGSGVTDIGDETFFGCSSLASITIPDSVTRIGENAFYDCSSLTSITIPDSVTEIYWNAFDGCSNLTSITIGSGITSIDDWDFNELGNLEKVTIGSGVTSIGSQAFLDCSGLTSVTIGSGVTSIGEQAFSGCSSLTNITIPDGVTNIGRFAFDGCSSLTSITIPNSAASIGYGAFYGCSGLTSVTIPDGVMSIGGSAFSGCIGLTSITIPDSVSKIWGYAFNNCGNLTDIYYTGIIEQWNATDIYDGNECLTRANVHAFADLKLSLDHEYITMKLNDSAVPVFATVAPEEWSCYLSWSAENPDGKEIISVSANGEITPLAVGTAYAIATVTVSNNSITARCRVDVTENSAEEEIEVTGVQLGATAVTSELYSRNYAEFDIVLVLPQNNISAMGVASAVTEDNKKPENNGIAIKSARFTDDTAADKFELVVVDDRRVAVVPKDSAINNPKSVNGSYSSAVAVTVGDTEFLTDAKLKLTVKKTQPKLKASVAAFNSFYSSQSNTIEITGATVKSMAIDASKKNVDWLTLDAESNTLTLNAKAPQKSASGSVYLKVYTEEWAISAPVTLNVKNTYKAPKLKLSSSSVKFSTLSSGGVELQLLPTAKNETLEKYNVTELKASDGYTVESFDPTTGTFTLIAPTSVKSGKITLSVGFGDTETTVPVTLSVQATVPTIKLKTSTVTLNPAYNDSAIVDMVITPADFEITDENVTVDVVASTKGADKGDINAEVTAEGKLNVSVVYNNAFNCTYKVTVSIPGTKAKAVLTVKTCKDGLKPSATLKVSGAIDLTYPDNAAVITATVKNYSNVSEFTCYEGTITVKNRGEKEGTPENISNYFNVTLSGNVLKLTKKDDVELKVGSTYTVKSITLKNFTDNVDVAEKKLRYGEDIGDKVWVTATNAVKITVKQTAVNLKLSKNSLSLNKLYGDNAEINVTCSTKNYEPDNDKVIVSVMDKTGKNSVAGQLDAKYLDGKLCVGVNDKTISGAAYKVLVSADTGYKAATLTVTIPAKSTVTATIKAKGSIDTIRDDTKIVFTPTYKNTVSKPAKETIDVYSSDGKKVYEVDGLELTNFDAVSTNKYKARIVATFENGQTVSSPLVSITVKTGTAKVKATGTPTLYLKDRNSRGKFTLTSDDLTLNAIKDIEDGGIEIKDQKYRDMFELYDYGNGQYAIGFKDNNVTAAVKLKSASIPLNIRHTGNNNPAKPDATVTLKVTIVK